MRIDREILRTGWPWLASALVVLVTATVVGVTNTRDDRLVVPAGRYLPSSYSMDARVYASTVVLPSGVLTVGVTEAQHEVGDSPEWRERRPVDDGTFIGVTTQLSRSLVPFSTGEAADPTLATPITVAIVADGRRYPVRDGAVDDETYGLPAGGRLRGYLAVAGDPRDVTVEVGFDGETQTVNPRTAQRDAGRFAEIAGTPTAFTERDCPAPKLSAGYRPTRFGGSPSCVVENARRVPWIAGLGWAPVGRSWQAVAVYLGRNLDVERTGTGNDYFSTPYGNRIAMTLAGQPTKGVLTDNQAPPVRRINTVTGFFLVGRTAGPSQVELSMTFPHLVRSSESPTTAPLDPSVVVTWKVPVS